MIRASGSRPSIRAAPSSASSIAPAPSLSGEELPAVTDPVLDERRLELGELLQRGVGAGSSRRARARCRAPARPSRRRSPTPTRRRRAGGCAARTRPGPRARSRRCRRASRRSAPSEIVHCSGMSGLTIRHPSVVEYSCSWPCGNARSGLSITHGARLIDSTPPTRTTRGVPDLDRAAGLHRRIEARAAQAVDRRAGDRRRETRQQHRHPSDVAVVLAGGVGVAEQHVVDQLGVAAAATAPAAPLTACAARSSGRTCASPPP